jgi:purine-binding chemotaxis protein CheW
MDLRRRLNMKDREKDKLPMNVVVRTNNGVVSLLVDKIGDVLNVKGDTFETPPDNIDETTRELIKGIYKLKDQLLLILDTQEATSIATTDVSSN